MTILTDIPTDQMLINLTDLITKTLDFSSSGYLQITKNGLTNYHLNDSTKFSDLFDQSNLQVNMYRAQYSQRSHHDLKLTWPQYFTKEKDFIFRNLLSTSFAFILELEVENKNLIKAETILNKIKQISRSICKQVSIIKRPGQKVTKIGVIGSNYDCPIVFSGELFYIDHNNKLTKPINLKPYLIGKFTNNYFTQHFITFNNETYKTLQIWRDKQVNKLVNNLQMYSNQYGTILYDYFTINNNFSLIKLPLLPLTPEVLLNTSKITELTQQELMQNYPEIINYLVHKLTNAQNNKE